MTENNQNEEEILEENQEKIAEKAKHTTHQIPWKSSKWPSFPSPHQFWKWSNFFNNSFNKQRQWRAAWRWR